MPSYGFSQNVIDWYADYLGHRSQKTIANNVHSSWVDVSYGVPQGSILGPLLFIIYVNDLSKLNMSCQTLQYADDTVLYKSGRSVEEIRNSLQKDLNLLVNYCDANQ